jgi:hypothetical protein
MQVDKKGSFWDYTFIFVYEISIAKGTNLRKVFQGKLLECLFH